MSKKIDKFATYAFYFMAGIVFLILIYLFTWLFLKGYKHLSWSFLTEKSSITGNGGGIGIQLFNTLYIALITMGVSVPIALGAAIYLHEYAANSRFKQLTIMMVEIISSLPSIVVGLFGMLVFVLYFNLKFSVISGALALGIINLPLLLSNFESALASADPLQKQAGLALGLTKWEVITKVTLPSVIPSIITGLILALGRVVGEAATLIFTAGQSAPALDFSNWNPLNISSPLNVNRQAETLAVHIWKVSSQGRIDNSDLFLSASSLVLLVMILIINGLLRTLASYYEKKMATK